MWIIKRFNFGFDDEINPYRAMEDSWLLHAVHAPGDACDIALDEDGLSRYGENWEERRREIIESKRLGKEILPARYVPHNVNSKDQAFCLAALWNYWMETAELLLED